MLSYHREEERKERGVTPQKNKISLFIKFPVLFLQGLCFLSKTQKLKVF
jgi:hypothetical protein